MAETCHPARPHHELQAGSEQRGDQHVGGDHQRIVVAHERQDGKGEYDRHADPRFLAPGGDDARALLRQRRGGRRAGGAPEQAVRLHRQHDRHDDEFGDQRELRKRERQPSDLDRAERNAECFGEADDQGCKECAGYRPQSTDDGDDEHLGDHRQVHAEVCRLARELQCAGESREERAEREHRRVEQRLVHAERGGEDPILRGCADQYAEAGAGDEQREQQQYQGADDDEEQVILWHGASGDQPRRCRGRARVVEPVFGAPHVERRVAHNQHDTERCSELQEFRRGVESLQQQDLDQRAYATDGDCGEHDAAPAGEPRSRPSARSMIRRGRMQGRLPACTASRARN